MVDHVLSLNTNGISEHASFGDALDPDENDLPFFLSMRDPAPFLIILAQAWLALLILNN